jgi:hypothetical protein
MHLPIPLWYQHYLWLHPEVHQNWGRYLTLTPEQAQQAERDAQRAAQQGQRAQQGGWAPPGPGSDPQQLRRQQEYAAYRLVEEGEWLVGAQEHGVQPGRLYPCVRCGYQRPFLMAGQALGC